jgi:hypothetical protein
MRGSNMVNKCIDKIKWIGLDGFLVVLFFAICGIIFVSLVYKIDIIVGYIIPYIILLVVTAIFLRYLISVYSFIKKMSGKPKKE